MMENRCNSQQVEDNLKRIGEEMANAALQSQRKPADVRLMAVTKTVSPQLVNTAFHCGVPLFGENRAQELCEKYASYEFGSDSIHFIGTLQTNKVRHIIDKVSCIQSVNSLRLAEEINKRSATIQKSMDVLLEVNIGKEESKSGLEASEIYNIIDKVCNLTHLQVKGLMCIPPIGQTELETERYFDQMYKLFVDIKHKKLDNISMEILSMGMSRDYACAIRHGANLVRIGSGIFGARNR
ncbi:MAG: YggS family pyridoxal phosphate-dependent enzyme [Angelakisella sp.]|nr:YggS family pyridoxal phosphate-dependent enzyme [Angelakisella sp.]